MIMGTIDEVGRRGSSAERSSARREDSSRRPSAENGSGKSTLSSQAKRSLWSSSAMWTAERIEEFLAATQGRDVESRAELALDANGKVLAYRVRSLANMGAYAGTVGIIIQLLVGQHLRHQDDRSAVRRRAYQHGSDGRLSRRGSTRGDLFDRASGSNPSCRAFSTLRRGISLPGSVAP